MGYNSWVSMLLEVLFRCFFLHLGTLINLHRDFHWLTSLDASHNSACFSKFAFRSKKKRKVVGTSTQLQMTPKLSQLILSKPL